jgi:hypothetical protein
VSRTPRSSTITRALSSPTEFVMDVPVGRTQHESGSASFGISQENQKH